MTTRDEIERIADAVGSAALSKALSKHDVREALEALCEQARAEERERVGQAIEAEIEGLGLEVPDGSGCESGDPADFIAAQVRLALVRLIDQRDDARTAEPVSLTDAERSALRWAFDALGIAESSLDAIRAKKGAGRS